MVSMVLSADDARAVVSMVSMVLSADDARAVVSIVSTSNRKALPEWTGHVWLLQLSSDIKQKGRSCVYGKVCKQAFVSSHDWVQAAVVHVA